MSNRTITMVSYECAFKLCYRVRDNSGPATIQRVNALGLSVTRIAYLGPFTKLLFCSCAWSIDKPDDTLGAFLITKFPAWNSLFTS